MRAMNVDGTTNASSLAGLTGGRSTNAAGATGATTGGTDSLFGPATMVSLAAASAGTNTGLMGTYAPQSTVWQFDLTGVLAAGQGGGGIPQQAISEEQAEKEATMLKEALDLLDAGDGEGARELMEELLADNPTNHTAVQTLGNVELADGNYSEAAKLFEKAHGIDPTVGYDRDAQNARTLEQGDEAVLRKANNLLRASGYREEGIRLLITLTQRSPGFIDGRMALGEAMLNEGDGNNGMQQYAAAVNEAEIGELSKVEDQLRALVKEEPNAPFTRQLLAKTLLRQERWEEALSMAESARELAENPIPYERDVALAHVGVGKERLKRGDIASAMVSFERAKELSPTLYEAKMALAEGYMARAEQHMDRGVEDRALADYVQAATLLEVGGDRELKEQVAQSAYFLGRRLERERIAAGEDIDKEVSAYQIAYDLDADNDLYADKLAETRFALGEQYELEGELKAAAQSFQKALDIDEHNQTYKQRAIEAWINYGDDRRYNLNFDDAVDAFMTAFKLDKNNAVAKDKLGEAYNARGLDHVDWERYEEAARDFKSALLLFPDNAEYQANYTKWRGFYEPQD
jgi:tetratricopeptide (TPR) repeat protein